jgi:two-component system sensor histidine kinase MtrB
MTAPVGFAPRRGPGREGVHHLGLRARATVAFALGALALSAVLSLLAYELVRNDLVQQREDSVVSQTYLNARVVRDGLRAPDPDVPRLLGSLESRPGAASVLQHRGRWFANSLAFGRDVIPASLRGEVERGRPAVQRFVLGGEPWLVVGVPIPRVDAVYFEAFSLVEVERTLGILGYSLAGAALLTTVAGAAVGRWASGRVLRPLARVSEAAAAIAGGHLGIRLPATDDKDLAPLAASFNRMVDALSERIERDARFASDVSHELRSPLTTLSTSLDVLEARRSEMPARSRAALDLLAADMRRFQRMVEDLLEISRFDSGAAELHLEEVDVGELVRHALVAAGESGVVDVQTGLNGAVVRADKRRLERVIANLVDNARSYGGGVARVGLEREGPSVRLVVEDHGPGVRVEEREKVFERFFRGSAAGRRGTGEGSGLGLALVAEHVRLHGGRVWVEDRSDGRGARFVVELPVAA